MFFLSSKRTVHRYSSDSCKSCLVTFFIKFFPILHFWMNEVSIPFPCKKFYCHYLYNHDYHLSSSRLILYVPEPMKFTLIPSLNALKDNFSINDILTINILYCCSSSQTQLSSSLPSNNQSDVQFADSLNTIKDILTRVATHEVEEDS